MGMGHAPNRKKRPAMGHIPKLLEIKTLYCFHTVWLYKARRTFKDFRIVKHDNYSILI